MPLSFHQNIKYTTSIPILFANREEKTAVKLRQVLRLNPEKIEEKINENIDQYIKEYGKNANTAKNLAIIATKLNSTYFYDELTTKFEASDYSKGL